MDLELYILLPILVALCLLTFFLGWYINSRSNKTKIEGADNVAKKILSDAESKSKDKIEIAEKRSKEILSDAEKASQTLKKEKLLEVKDEFLKKKQQHEEEVKDREKDLVVDEKRIKIEKDNLETVKSELSKLEIKLNKSVELSDSKTKEAENKISESEKLILMNSEILEEQRNKLQRISGFSEEEARKVLFEKLINDAKIEAAQKIQEIREETKLESNRISKNIIIQSIQRTASDHSVETTVSVLQINSDELKGRIIGKEGR
ncbi:MAG TPA: Rnase Y domain-containing protein, partial [Ignavibacteria bacterium]|nr:Rnase Y domain-containing protein [Ignavibacteria bacterium]